MLFITLLDRYTSYSVMDDFEVTLYWNVMWPKATFGFCTDTWNGVRLTPSDENIINTFICR